MRTIFYIRQYPYKKISFTKTESLSRIIITRKVEDNGFKIRFEKQTGWTIIEEHSGRFN